MTIETLNPVTDPDRQAAVDELADTVSVANDITIREWEELVGADGAVPETFWAGSVGELKFLLIATQMSLGSTKSQPLLEALRTIQVEGFGGGTVRVIVDVLGKLHLAGAPVPLAKFQAPAEGVAAEGKASTIVDSAIARRARYALEALLTQRNAILAGAAPVLLDRVYTLRNEAVAAGNDVEAFRIDNLLEDFGMSVELRRTCYICRKVVGDEHEHSLATGALIAD